MGVLMSTLKIKQENVEVPNYGRRGGKGGRRILDKKLLIEFIGNDEQVQRIKNCLLDEIYKDKSLIDLEI